MSALLTKAIDTPDGEKTISVYAQDILTFGKPLDVMTVSAFYRGYRPTRGTLLGSLYERGISIEALSQNPEIDLRENCHIWLSRSVTGSDLPFGRIGCVELRYHRDLEGQNSYEEPIISSIRAYFHMLHIATLSGIKIETLGLPIFGAGRQKVDTNLTVIPTLNECFRFLKENDTVRDISIVSINQGQAYQFARALENSYSAQVSTVQPARGAESSQGSRRVFISYSSGDKNIADNLCSKLEANGVKVWYAPRNIHSSDYASAIVDAITRCTHFVVIISKNSLASNHVLNEVDLAFQELGRGTKIMPLKIDEEEMGPSFRYYLSRQHWMDAHVPPLEKRLEEFVASVLAE